MWNILAPMLGPIINKLVDRIPDENARATAKEEFEKELLNAVTAASQSQTKINEIEAAHSSVFVAGWRPFIGWVCGVGILWAFIVQPIVVWVDVNFDTGLTHLSSIDTDGLYQLVLAMLGMGGLRTFEKIKGVSRETSPGKK
ncbi:3TM-type holin [Sessilibacter corallicola]|uniref:Holin of 3TMs, for gene-transfer release n=1 Tax=Sessilibacter corallicola TaxID=2904075 RepID=A0ABQ0AF30_9GAMM